MKLGHYVTASYLVSGLCAAMIAVFAALAKEPVPPSLGKASSWLPTPVVAPPQITGTAMTVVLAPIDSTPVTELSRLSAVVSIVTPLPSIEPPILKWSHELAAGETLGALLGEAGLTSESRAEVLLALGAEYNLRGLRPGHRITVEKTSDGRPRYVALNVEDGIQIEAIFGEELATRVVEPTPEIETFARSASVEQSIFSALDEAGIPARFAVDLAQVLGDTIDFRRDFAGGERLRVLWRAARVGNESIGQPKILFAALELDDVLFEVVWPMDDTGRATVYQNGEVMRVIAEPIEAARVTSVFGRRKHPVYGSVRMHTGVDFAAATGTPVYATAPGRISFIGWRGGYGRVVEITHGSQTTTRYAHLSAAQDDLKSGRRVAAGDIIGYVGATGTATGPNLHYEVLVDGEPTDPLSKDQLALAMEPKTHDRAALSRLLDARAQLVMQLEIAEDSPSAGRI